MKKFVAMAAALVGVPFALAVQNDVSRFPTYHETGGTERQLDEASEALSKALLGRQQLSKEHRLIVSLAESLINENCLHLRNLLLLYEKADDDDERTRVLRRLADVRENSIQRMIIVNTTLKSVGSGLQSDDAKGAIDELAKIADHMGGYWQAISLPGRER